MAHDAAQPVGPADEVEAPGAAPRGSRMRWVILALLFA